MKRKLNRNNKIFLIIVVILSLLSLFACKNKEAPKEIDENQDILDEEKLDNVEEENKKEAEDAIEENDNIEEVDNIKEIIESMTIEEKIGQLMIFGLNGEGLDQHTVDMIEKNHIGGFILFKPDIVDENQTLELLNSLKAKNSSNPIPLFLSIDEEGGRVSRLSDIFGKLPQAKLLGDINDQEISLKYGEVLGMRIKSLGFNMDFAPVFDINSNPQNPVIGNRAIGSTVDLVVDNGLQVMKGINSEKIISIIKHFPGHGDTDVDSHVNIPRVDKKLEDLQDLELIPFIKGIEEDVDGIMIGHILYSELDEKCPATMSKDIIGNLLREKLLYKGVVFSDDMTMGAISENYNIEDSSIEFLKAGGDILLICHGYENQIRVIDKIQKEVENGVITIEELNEKIYRIIILKEKYAIKDTPINELEIDIINQRRIELLEEMESYK